MKEFIPHAYQSRIVEQIVNVPRSCVFAGMGMGKTSSTLTALDALYELGDSKPTLVLAPLRVCVTTWPEEVKKWSHLSGLEVVPVTGIEDERKKALKRDVPIYACNYQNVPWLIDHFGSHWPFDKVIADESTRLKSFRTRQGGVRARALGQVAHTKVKRFVNLTGTPAPNGLADLWGQMWFIDRGERLERSYSKYMSRWFTKSENGFTYELRHESLMDEIYAKLKDVCLTIDPKDYFNLDEPIIKDIEVEMPARAWTMYKKLRDEMVLQLEQGLITAANAAVKTMKLLQVANGAAYLDQSIDDDGNPRSREYRVLHDAKLSALESIIEEANGAPVLVAYHFRSDLERLLKAFPKAEVLDSDPETIKRWNKGKIPILLAHPQSAGHGISLQDGGNILVFFAHNWNLEDRLQIIERIGPMRQKQSGYDRPVWIYNIITRGTVDKMVMQRVAGKKSVMDLLLENLK